ncbi:heme peroxidase [Cercophora newfieldiana]|uniref:Peroxidase n=1 Tax=Cercophora newfieldiana TaxID=92897 RepID=A0AA39Y9U0_9PEZI|nr:heme peroxidase [Cercophora newfieldiana]
MMWTTIFTVALATLPTTQARPGMGKVMAEIMEKTERMTERDAMAVHPILKKKASGSNAVYKAPGPKDSDACSKDKCCIWSYIVADMVAAFTEDTKCSSLARGAIRLGFHDASSWNTSMPVGGADGSILFSGELSRPENGGLQDIGHKTIAWFEQYKQYGVSGADLVQVGANVATVVCPGGPRTLTLVGRPDSDFLPPRGLLPRADQGAPALLDMFNAKGISPAELVALMGAHSVSRQNFVNPAAPNAPQDTTPGDFDNRYFSETSAVHAPGGVVRFASDIALAHDPATSAIWNSFGARDAQAPWAEAYAAAYLKMSLMGVKDVGALTDCTATLPLPR